MKERAQTLFNGVILPHPPFSRTKRAHNERLFKLGSFAHKGACPYCNPSYLGLASMHAPSEREKKRESNEGERGAPKAKEGSIKKNYKLLLSLQSGQGVA